MPDTQKHVRPIDFRIGALDNSGEKISRIYFQSADYVIYRSRSTIYVDIDDDSEDLERLHDANMRIASVLARVYSFLPGNLNWIEPINKQIARAVALNLSGATPQARDMLGDVELRVRRLKVISGRLQYTVSSLLTAATITLANFWLNSPAASGGAVGVSHTQIATCGALGGFLSVVLGFRVIEIDCDANWFLNCLIGSSRILVAMVAAVFAYFVVKSGIALQPLAEANSPYGFYTVAILAGFSERFVPNIMDNLTRAGSQGQLEETLPNGEDGTDET